MSEDKDTIVAIATPPGKGGIGVIRVSGSKSKAIYSALTDEQPIDRKAQYVAFKGNNNEILDKGIGLFFKTPASYTGEDVIECHTHGNQILLKALQDKIVSLGARLAQPGEFTERAFLNDKIDLIQAEAVADLIDSRSRKAARSAMQSLDGAFSKTVNQLRARVFNARVLIEAALDFPEEEAVVVDIAPAIADIKHAQTELTALLARAEAGRVLNSCPTIVIAGLPNAGKSCLINYLTSNDTAIVSSEQGTTRDIVREQVLLGDYAVTLLDTAGLRETDNAIEKEGVKRSRKALKIADIILYVVDNQVTGETDDAVKKGLVTDAKVLTVRNKIDLCRSKYFSNTEDTVYISAKTGEGLSQMTDKICHILALSENNEDVIIARQRHIDALNAVKTQLSQTIEMAEENTGLEVLAESLRLVLAGFDAITGKTTANDVLDKVFSQFCIGK